MGRLYRGCPVAPDWRGIAMPGGQREKNVSRGVRSAVVRIILCRPRLRAQAGSSGVSIAERYPASSA